MTHELFMDKYPVYTLEVAAQATNHTGVDSIIDALKAKISHDPKAAYIAVFDHYAHTAALPDGEIAPEILEAKNLIFCFGPKLPGVAMMAVRPRSIGVIRHSTGFSLSFLEAPMPPINDKMKSWVTDVMTQGV